MTIYHWDAFNATEDCEALNKAMKGLGKSHPAHVFSYKPEKVA